MKRILALTIFHVSLDPLLLFSFFEDAVMEGLGGSQAEMKEELKYV